MSYIQYAACTWREYLLRRVAHNRMRNSQYEHTRVVVYTIASANRDPKKPWPSLQDFWPLPGDEEIRKKEENALKQERTGLIERINKSYGAKLLKTYGKLLE